MNIKQKILQILGIDHSYPSIKNELRLYAKVHSKIDFQPSEVIDVIIPSFNRLRELKRTIKNLKSFKNIRLIIVDNNSEQETKDYLGQFKTINTQVIFLKDNMGGSKARIEGIKHVKSRYVAFLDNDIVTFPFYFENLINTLNNNPNISAVQSKVILPNKKIQINSPYFEIKDDWIIFNDSDSEKSYDDSSTIKQKECNSIPIGATLWRTEIFKNYTFDEEFTTSYEDNDLAYRMSKKGIRFMNCPKAICLHIPSNFAPDKTNIYFSARFNKESVWNSAKKFYQKHHLYFVYGNIDGHVKYLRFNSKQEYIEFLKS